MTDLQKQHLRELEKLKYNLICDFNWSLIERNNFLQYFLRYKSCSEAEDRYYTEKWIESGFDSEGLFSMHHETLSKRIKENKKERKEIIEKIKKIKIAIKSFQIECNKN